MATTFLSMNVKSALQKLLVDECQLPHQSIYASDGPEKTELTIIYNSVVALQFVLHLMSLMTKHNFLSNLYLL